MIRGWLKELGTMMRVYEDQKVTVLVPEAKLVAAGVTKGDEVLLGTVGPTKRSGARGPTVRGTVKRVMVEIEVDMTTVETPQHEGQEQML